MPTTPQKTLKTIIGAICLCAVLYFSLCKVSADLSQTNLHYAQGLLIVGLLVLAVLLVCSVKIRFTVVDCLVLLFAVYVGANYLFMSSAPAVNKANSWLFMLVLYMVLRVVFSFGKQQTYILLFALIVCGTYQSILGLLQVYGFSHSHHSVYKVTGSFFNPGPYSGYVVAILAVCGAYIYTNHASFKYIHTKGLCAIAKNMWAMLYILAAVCVLVGVVVLPATLSRAAIVSGFVVVVALLFAHKKYKLVIPLVCAMLVVGVGMYYLKQGSADGRVLMWQVASNVFANNWINGVGFGGFASAYANGQAAYFSAHPHSELLSVASCPEYAFSEYLHLGVELGTIGLVLFVSIVGIALWRLFALRSAFAYGLLAMLVFACFSYPLSLLPFQILVVVFVAYSASCSLKPVRPSAKSRVAMVVCLTMCLFAVYALLPAMQKRIVATQEYKTLSYIYTNDFYDGANHDYKPLLNHLLDNPKYLFSYGRALNKLGHYNASNAILQQGTQVSSDPMFYNVIGNNYKALGAYTQAEEAYKKAFAIVPNRMYPLHLLLQLHKHTSQNTKAKQTAQQIINMKPKITSPATLQMQNEAKESLTDIQ